MKKTLMSLGLFAAGMALIAPVLADRGERDEDRDERNGPITLAIYGDAPYGCKAPTSAGAPDECPPNSPYAPDSPDNPNPGDPRQLEATPGFIAAINRDPRVRLVIHAGDIHSGSGYCTKAYNQRVLDLWKAFEAPLVYTPGDNEWTDCQKAKEGGGVKNSSGQYVDYAAGHPVANLALVRSMFFPEAGVTLGRRAMNVVSQAEAFDPAHPSDAEYVENVYFEKAGVLFVTLNIPGGFNNDDDLWNTGAFGTARSAPQIQEVAQRTGADLRWLDTAFAIATAHGDKAVMIVSQADMWDLDGTGPSPAHIANYEPFIAKVAALTKAFGKPVLMINGDSHHYRSDNPLTNDAPCVGETGSGTAVAPCAEDDYDTHPYYPGGLPNFHRLVVHGSSFPLEYLRMTVDPRRNAAASASSFGPFSWERVVP